jgi:hypothetical protein
MYCDVQWLWVQFGLEISMNADTNQYQHNSEKLFESWQWISEPHGENPALDYTFPVHFLYITPIIHLTYERLVLD